MTNRGAEHFAEADDGGYDDDEEDEIDDELRALYEVQGGYTHD